MRPKDRDTPLLLASGPVMGVDWWFVEASLVSIPSHEGKAVLLTVSKCVVCPQSRAAALGAAYRLAARKGVSWPSRQRTQLIRKHNEVVVDQGPKLVQKRNQTYE